jgi:DNA-binding transcriptional LysR family regulator
VELAQLEAFLEAARRGSFHKAAKALYLAQPSLSARVRSLEDELGVPLFERQGRGVRLTDMGKRFLPFAQRAMDSVRDGRELITTSRFSSGGVLTIASARGIGAYTLPAILANLRARHPDIKTHINVGRSRDVMAMVVNEEAQVGFARDLTHPDVVTSHLYDEDIVLVTHPKHRFAKAKHVEITEVAQEPFILYDPGSNYFQLLERVSKQAGIAPRVEMRLDSIDATKRMVELGLGISFLPASGIRREVEQDSIAQISLGPEYRVVLPTCVLVRRQQHYAPQVLALMEVLQAMYKQEIPALKRT